MGLYIISLTMLLKNKGIIPSPSFLSSRYLLFFDYFITFYCLLFSMSGFLEAVSKVSKFALRWDDDFYDRLSHRYTVMFLALFTVVSEKGSGVNM